MTDRLDDEIRRALAVEPSPEFLARVRMRIADEPDPAGFQIWWLWGSAAVAALLVVALVWQLQPNRRQVTMPAALGARSFAGASELMPARAAALPHERAARPEAIPARVNPLPSVPEVLIAADEARALRALILGVQEGRIDLTPALSAAPIVVAAPPPIDAIEIQPITIAPIAPLSGEQGVRQ